MLKKLIRKIDPVALICFIVLSLVLNIGFLMYSINRASKDSYETYLINKEKFGRALHAIATRDLQMGDHHDVVDLLSDAIELGDIHGCILKKKGRVVFSAVAHPGDEIPYPKEESTATYTSADYEWVTSKVGDFYVATVFKKSEEYYRKIYFGFATDDALTKAFFSTGLAAALLMLVPYTLTRSIKKLLSFLREKAK